MILLRNILFQLAFYLGSIVLVLGVAVMALISPRQARAGAHIWSRYVQICTRVFLGIRLQVDGTLPSGGGVIVAPKHESFYEAMLLPAIFPSAAVVMKRELSRIPVWGWVVTRHGSIFVDREAKSSAMRSMLNAAARAVEEDREIVIFPEGSRAEAHQAPPLRPGVAGLYRLLKLPVVPVSLNSAHVWPRKGLKRPGTVRLKVMPVIPAGLPRDEFEARLHAAINGQTAGTTAP
ncbi:lysophospholipid acyltransferase family protein [Pacificimonas flava]|uniref:Phospholipid/glycerol acyltransferase n=1 Tax=Pacificimonas flava TaxID=1234595 RepID=M2TAA2_9SPHN|nr:lysophospholipid acyltransferase family protein [Pacificimonas flava]EMD83519.1 phospholipid/glycerol acyltransferase [Pacificimonas flava]MBB5278928.1 1-acyl-sn-glycerol-3-phosphate acyltransferase [Pacificimonas flava]